MGTDNGDSNGTRDLGKAAHLVTADYDDPANLGFDFEGYFEKKGTDDEFQMRIMGQFCRDFWKNGNACDVPYWIMNYIAERFHQVLVGDTFNNALPLPWDPADPVRSRAEELSLSIFCDVTNQLKSSEQAKVTNIIASVAQDYNVSYETARAAYYKHIKLLPKDFLKREKKT